MVEPFDSGSLIVENYLILGLLAWIYLLLVLVVPRYVFNSGKTDLFDQESWPFCITCNT
jgi:hypothetical protein